MAERFLTYGSAWDCGFNNQRIDPEQAVGLLAYLNAPWWCATSRARALRAQLQRVIRRRGRGARRRCRVACGVQLGEADGLKKKKGHSRWGAGCASCLRISSWIPATFASWASALAGRVPCRIRAPRRARGSRACFVCRHVRRRLCGEDFVIVVVVEGGLGP